MLRTYQVLVDFILDTDTDGATEQRTFFRGETFTAEQLDTDGPDGTVVELRLEGGFQAWFDTDCIWPVATVALILAGADSCMIRVDDSWEDIDQLYAEYLQEQGEGAGWASLDAWLRNRSVRICAFRIVRPRAPQAQQVRPEEQAEAIGPVQPSDDNPLFTHWRARRDITLPPMHENDTEDIVWTAGTVWRAARLAEQSTPRQTALLLRANRVTVLFASDAVEEVWLGAPPPVESTYGGDQEAE